MNIVVSIVRKVASIVAPGLFKRVPLSKKTIIGLLAGCLGALLPLIGVYHVPAVVQGAISAGEAFLAGVVVKEEEKYLTAALAARKAGK